MGGGAVGGKGGSYAESRKVISKLQDLPSPSNRTGTENYSTRPFISVRASEQSLTCGYVMSHAPDRYPGPFDAVAPLVLHQALDAPMGLGDTHTYRLQG